MKKVKGFYNFLQLNRLFFSIRQNPKKTDNQNGMIVFFIKKLWHKTLDKAIVFKAFHHAKQKKQKKIKKISKKLLTFEKKWCIITLA